MENETYIYTFYNTLCAVNLVMTMLESLCSPRSGITRKVTPSSLAWSRRAS